jgi:hypothetical protein
MRKDTKEVAGGTDKPTFKNIPKKKCFLEDFIYFWTIPLNRFFYFVVKFFFLTLNGLNSFKIFY